jgi:hypothetical protein
MTRRRFGTWALPALLSLPLLAVAPVPAAAQEAPITFMRVTELRALLNRGGGVQIVDVRSRQEYLARHLPGAVSIPLNTLEARAGEVSRQGLVVLY